MKYRLFIFDFDGTIGDSSGCVVASFQRALSFNDLPTCDEEAIVHTMGLSLGEQFQKVTGGNYSDELYEKLVKDYRKAYGDLLEQKTKLFPGVSETLKQLNDRKVTCAIATSKKTQFAVRSCEFLGITPYFTLIIGDDMVESKKPNPEMIYRILNKTNISKSQAVMVGDATTDIIMGNAAGVDTIGVTWGAHSRKELLGVNPTKLIDSFKELALI